MINEKALEAAYKAVGATKGGERAKVAQAAIVAYLDALWASKPGVQAEYYMRQGTHDRQEDH